MHILGTVYSTRDTNLIISRISAPPDLFNRAYFVHLILFFYLVVPRGGNGDPGPLILKVVEEKMEASES